MTDRYVKVRCTLITVRADAILVDIADPGDPHILKRWIPLSLIHGGDERKIGNDHSTDEVSFRLMAWKAKELGMKALTTPLTRA